MITDFWGLFKGFMWLRFGQDFACNYSGIHKDTTHHFAFDLQNKSPQ